MTMDIPLSRQDEQLDRAHAEEKREHRDDIQRDERYAHADEGYHQMKEAKEVRDARLGHEEKARAHAEEKREHRDDIQRDERYAHADEGYHQMKEAKEVRDARLGHEEKAERRQVDEHDAALVEEANAVLDPQNQ